MTRRSSTACAYFYQSHAGGNATTGDLRRVLEGHTSEPLEAFFDQWLRRSEVPELRVAWGWDTATRQAVVEVDQIQGGEPYEIPLQIAFHVGGEIERRTITLRRTRDEARVSLPARPTAIDIDPETWLLHVATVTRRAPRSARSSTDNEMSGR